MLKNKNKHHSSLDLQQFKDELQQQFIQLFAKHTKNKLISSIIYSYTNLINLVDIKLFHTIFTKFENKINQNILMSLITSSIIIYLSFSISYNFEHMLNKNIYNEKPSLHIIYGETIAQLAAFCLYIESQNVILNNEKITTNEKTKLIDLNICISDKFDGNLQNDIEIITSQNKNQLLENDLQHKFKNILLVLLQCIYYFLNKQNIDTNLLNDVCIIIVKQHDLQKKLKINKINTYEYNKELIKHKLEIHKLVENDYSELINLI